MEERVAKLSLSIDGLQMIILQNEMKNGDLKIKYMCKLIMNVNLLINFLPYKKLMGFTYIHPKFFHKISFLTFNEYCKS